MQDKYIAAGIPFLTQLNKMGRFKFITLRRNVYLILYQIRAKRHFHIYVGDLKMKILKLGILSRLQMLKDKYKIGI